MSLTLKPSDSLKAVLSEATNTAGVQIYIPYATKISPFDVTNYENSNFTATTDTELFNNNTASDKYIIKDIVVYNADNIDHTISFKINNTLVWKVTVPAGEDVKMSQEGTGGGGADGNDKVKADNTDDTPGYLSDKIDTATLDVDTTLHKLKVKDGVFAAASHTHDDRYYTETEVDNLLNNKADASHTHTFTDLTDTPSSYTGSAGKILAVKTTEDGIEFINAPSGGGNTTPLYDGYIAGEQVVGTIITMPIPINTTTSKFKIALGIKPDGNNFIVKVYKNGTAVYTATIATTATAINGLYIADDVNTVTWNENDKCEIKIEQVGSTVSGSDFSFQLI